MKKLSSKPPGDDMGTGIARTFLFFIGCALLIAGTAVILILLIAGLQP